MGTSPRSPSASPPTLSPRSWLAGGRAHASRNGLPPSNLPGGSPPDSHSFCRPGRRADGDHMPWVLRTMLEFAQQLCRIHPQIMGFGGVGGSPHLSQQPSSRRVCLSCTPEFSSMPMRSMPRGFRGRRTETRDFPRPSAPGSLYGPVDSRLSQDMCHRVCGQLPPAQ